MRPRHVLLAALVLAFTALPATAARGATRVVHWSPFAGDGSLRSGLIATPRFRGDCWTGSFVLHRGFRCMTGHRIYDPCFEDPLRDGVVCVADPFARGVIRLRVTGDLSDDGSAQPGTVWAVRLRSGAHAPGRSGRAVATTRRPNTGSRSGPPSSVRPERRGTHMTNRPSAGTLAP